MEAETAQFEQEAEAFAGSVQQLEALISPLFSQPIEAVLQQSESLIDKASLCVLVSYAINSLVFLFLRTQGRTKGHPVRKELQRVKEYMDKVSHAAGVEKAAMKLDKEAAARFIKHTLRANPIEGKAYSEQERDVQAQQFLDAIVSNGAEDVGCYVGMNVGADIQAESEEVAMTSIAKREKRARDEAVEVQTPKFPKLKGAAANSNGTGSGKKQKKSSGTPSSSETATSKGSPKVNAKKVRK
ncbi:hypothetical protein BC830DRAFT_1116301 [Chytriomyces sp. MP71]|nr:hypothetical protein BC830DRAFT_1116301 [Chytriomyces sp. MP71]